ncbi:MAG: hypothetical protein IJH34_05900 [Romboutsia sp.]|nr:hypothetical protein [Romboutsia sp.]
MLAVKESVPCVNDPPLKEPLVKLPPLNFDVSIAVGVFAVQEVISSAEIFVPNVGKLPASQLLALPTEVVVYFNVLSPD